MSPIYSVTNKLNINSVQNSKTVIKRSTIKSTIKTLQKTQKKSSTINIKCIFSPRTISKYFLSRHAEQFPNSSDWDELCGTHILTSTTGTLKQGKIKENYYRG